MVHIYDQESGYYLSEDHRRVAELLKEYDHTLELAWIPPDQRNFNDTQPFAVICRPEGREPYIVKRFAENEVNHKLLGYIYASDNARGNPYQMLVAEEEAAEILKMKQQMEEREELKEIGATILGSPLHTFRHNGKVYR